MQLTLAQIASLATTQIGGRNDYTLSEMSLYANMALGELCERVEMQSLQSTAYSSTTSGTSSFTIPTNCHYITTVSNVSMGPSSGRTLDPVSYHEIDSYTTAVGVPRIWGVYRDQVMLWPSADSGYSFQVRFQEKVPVLVASSATPGIDPKFHQAVVWRTAAIAASMRNGTENEALAQARYLSQVGSTPTDRAAQQATRFHFSMPKWQRH